MVSEMLLSSSIRNLVPVARCDDHIYPSPGPLGSGGNQGVRGPVSARPRSLTCKPDHVGGHNKSVVRSAMAGAPSKAIAISNSVRSISITCVTPRSP